MDDNAANLQCMIAACNRWREANEERLDRNRNVSKVTALSGEFI
jgi:hypothetical protein